MSTHILTIEVYAHLKLEFEVTAQVGIRIAQSMTDQVKNKWTKHACGGYLYHMDKYFDIYNEGSVSCIPKEDWCNKQPPKLVIHHPDLIDACEPEDIDRRLSMAIYRKDRRTPQS